MKDSSFDIIHRCVSSINVVKEVYNTCISNKVSASEIYHKVYKPLIEEWGMSEYDIAVLVSDNCSVSELLMIIGRACSE